MPSSPETCLVHPDDAHRVAPARLDGRLRGTTFLADLRTDARVLDPRLAEVVQDAARTAAQTGHSEGFDAGYERGLAEAREHAAAEAAHRRASDERALADALTQLSSVAASLAAAADHLEQRGLPVHDAAAAELGTLVCDLVEELLGRELETPRQHVLDAVRRASAAAARGAALVLHLHPEDVAVVTDAGIDLHALTHRPVTVVPDPSVERGGAVADSGARRIDACLGTAVGRLRAELTA